MASSRRVGRTLRRPRRRSAVNGSASTRSAVGAGPLQAIEENTVVELTTDDALPPPTLTSPSPQKQSKKPKKKKKKRPRESALFQSEKRRKQQLDAMLDELETQVQEQCDQLVADAERRAQELEMELKVQLLFLPEAVRQMPWKTFVEDFGGDLQNVIHSLSQPSPLRTRSSLARHDIVAATPCSVADLEESGDSKDDAEDDEDYQDSGNRRLSAFTTPMSRQGAGKPPATVLRTARKGETTYSVRGSPIMPETVAKAPAGSLVATFDGLEPTTCLRLDN
ncbi:hypothetical protein PF006_g10191 [Phytophthora fragariae]|uniref:Uncharacterized protein n=1 Tax=Phytophthora fragariae TaxID=53985 RepID=A0A6A3U1N8_9STRA|nr:hypothetical protein PF009_g12242 [Phytophthora fragariae]KAE9011045.1 hypothetical protein PF011_g9540 [Phytophthora fragariae]KAE9144921.1 hypothetical protein PF006_g10191 [Phytophthora fragariae]